MTFKQFLNETPIRTGVHDSNNYSFKKDWDFYKNSQFITKIEDNFTSKKYDIYKTDNKMFIVKNNTYKLGIEYSIDKYFNINIAHSNEKGLYGKFLDYLLHKYKIVFSGLQQSTQAEKSWNKLFNKYDIVIQDKGKIFDISKNDIDKYYGKPIRIGIRESTDDNYEIRSNIIKTYNTEVDIDKILFRSEQW